MSSKVKTPRGSQPTIYDIAEKAGISSSSVSRALNGSRLVSDDMREKVQSIANEIGFEKRNVRRHRERAILNIRLVLSRHDAPERSLFFDLTRLIAGLRDGFTPTSINLVCEIGGPDFIPFPHKKGGDTDAFVFAFHLPSAKTLAELQDLGVPYIILNRATPGLSCISADHTGGMQDLVAHVTAGGRSIKPCLIAIELENEVFAERLASLKVALHERKIPFPDTSVIHFESIAAINRERIQKVAAEFDTLFCINDLVGCATLMELALLGISVPDQCQVTGFDDSPVRRLTRPLLTTVAMPVYDLGRSAGERLVNQVIEGAPNTQLKRLRGSLLIGESTHAAPIS
jgi:DNA-binding LacI/PurR family transcriptional regulator